MTEESPERDPSDYQFPDQYLNDLHEEEDNSPWYCIVQGQLYEAMRSDVRFDATDAMDVSRYLNNGEVEKAEDFIYDQLDGELDE